MRGDLIRIRLWEKSEKERRKIMDGKKEQLELAIKGIGATAEMAMVFYRAAIEAGAISAEAIMLTQAYLAAILFGSQKPPESEEG